MADTGNSIQETGIPRLVMTVAPATTVYAPVDKTLSISEMPADAKATGDAINNVSADVADLAADVQSVMSWTAEDIPLTGDDPNVTVADMLPGMWPVGSVYVTTQDSVPDMLAALGVWVEIAIPLTHGDKLRGTRSYTEVEVGFTPGNLRFFLRTE